ncbi:DHA2 family efflux MFS transporter permease subunit [Sodalis sp. dw_96]|uniref:DHA2 family efflux MFS transporter permease subunit n=1 Tax=Sodalis sp. dw_96 TaxID=2719794 RepID=UPI001BD57A10|nr:DHA2 family efflux MFS transporter permease subunit [Sodalis sp. dw_96]
MSVNTEGTPEQKGVRTLKAAALLATYMQAVNLSLPNAALSFIQGSLSMSDDEVGWIFTAYLAASAISMPLAQWLAVRYGLKRVFQTALALFTMGLLLGTLATSPLEFVGARIVQGAASGILGPLSMAIVVELLPAARRVKFGHAWTAIVLFGIASGPGIGGWLSEYYGWRALFYISLPLTGFIAIATALSLADKKAGKSAPFDFFGFGTFTVGMIALQMMLDRGERMEWFASSEIRAEALASALAFYLYMVHILTAKVHFLNKALFRNRNFVFSTIIFFAAGFVLLSTMALTSPMLNELLGYPPATTGFMTIPRGIGLLSAFILMGRISESLDPRPWVAAGIALVIYANFLILGYSPAMDWWPVAVTGAIQGIGLGVLMPSLAKVAFSTLAPGLRAEGAGFFNLARVYGSTMGVAVVQIFFFNNSQAMHQAFASHLTPYFIAAHNLAASTSPVATAALNEMITGQASFVALVGQFKLLLLAMAVVSPLALLFDKAATAD